MAVWLCFLNVKKRGTTFLGEASKLTLSPRYNLKYISLFSCKSKTIGEVRV